MPPYVCGMFYKLVVNFLAASDGFRMIARFSLSGQRSASGEFVSPRLGHHPRRIPTVFFF